MSYRGLLDNWKGGIQYVNGNTCFRYYNIIGDNSY